MWSASARLPGDQGYGESSPRLSVSSNGCDGKGEEAGISPSQFMKAQILQISLVLGTVKTQNIPVCSHFPRYFQVSSVTCCLFVQVLHVLRWGQAVKVLAF